MKIDTLLREAIHAHAGEAGAARRLGGLASMARQRARQRRNRRLLAGAAALVAAMAMGTLAIPHLARPGGDAPVVLAQAGYELPDFPYTPGWLPDGVADPHVQLWSGPETGPEVVVEHEAAAGDSESPLIQMRLLDADYRDGPVSTTASESVVVRGTVGVLASDGRWHSVTWTDPSGQTVQVGAADRWVGREDLLRYIEELVTQPLPVTPPATLASVPVGAEAAVVVPYLMHFDLPDGRWVTLTVHEPDRVDDLRADLRSSPEYQLPPPTAVQVAGRPGELVDIGGGRLALSVSFGPALMLTIRFWSQDQQQLLAFAEGVALTPYARPAPFS